MKLSIDEKLAIYRRSLKRYEANGREDTAKVQRELIAKLEKEKRDEQNENALRKSKGRKR